MALNLKTPESEELRPRITVFGVGGAGGNAVNNMIEKNLEGAEFVVANTDAQALAQSRAPAKVQLGVGVTQGLGAGAKPDVGAGAAEESMDDIVKVTIFLGDQGEWAKMNDIYRSYFTSPLPARSTCSAGLVIPGFLLEMECVAYKPE